MAKEKIIYLGPEEELTSVRERLENATDGRIILVIPAQTQLLSRVGWMLLHSHVRKLGKDVLIISSNRQIRAASKAAGFRVANSLESLPSYRPRPSNRPVRSDTSGKTSQGINKQGSSGNKDTRPLRSGQQQVPLPFSKNGSMLSSSDEMKAGIDSHYELQTETVAPPCSEAGDQEDSEIDSLEEDYYVARNIRESAQEGDAGAKPSITEKPSPSSSTLEQSSKIPPQSGMDDDPFAYMENIQSVTLPEQRASMFIQDIDQGIPDISDVPTDVHDVKSKIWAMLRRLCLSICCHPKNLNRYQGNQTYRKRSGPTEYLFAEAAWKIQYDHHLRIAGTKTTYYLHLSRSRISPGVLLHHLHSIYRINKCW